MYIWICWICSICSNYGINHVHILTRAAQVSYICTCDTFELRHQSCTHTYWYSTTSVVHTTELKRGSQLPENVWLRLVHHNNHRKKRGQSQPCTHIYTRHVNISKVLKKWRDGTAARHQPIGCFGETPSHGVTRLWTSKGNSWGPTGDDACMCSDCCYGHSCSHLCI